MLSFDDDAYACSVYNCTGCEQKEYLLQEAASEMKELVTKITDMSRVRSETEEKLLDNLENVCHMLGIPFKGVI